MLYRPVDRNTNVGSFRLCPLLVLGYINWRFFTKNKALMPRISLNLDQGFFLIFAQSFGGVNTIGRLSEWVVP